MLFLVGFFVVSSGGEKEDIKCKLIGEYPRHLNTFSIVSCTLHSYQIHTMILLLLLTMPMYSISKIIISMLL